jgi:AraC family transcriptional activator of pobA
MNSTYDTNNVYCGNLTEVARYQRPEIRLCGCNGYHTALWISRGKAKLTVDGQTRTIPSETGVIIDAAAPKMIEISNGSFGTVLALRATGDFYLPAPQMVAHIPNIGEQQKLAGFMEYLTDEQSHDAFGADAAKFHLAHYYFVHLARLARQPAAKRTCGQKLMSRFARLLEQNFANGDGLSDYADTLRVTTTHLTRVCQTLNGKSATQFIQDRVLAEARHMLATTHRPVVAIGADLGFSSPAYFTRLFSHKAGMAPTEFRRDNQPQPKVPPLAWAAAE